MFKQPISKAVGNPLDLCQWRFRFLTAIASHEKAFRDDILCIFLIQGGNMFNRSAKVNLIFITVREPPEQSTKRNWHKRIIPWYVCRVII